ncbi:hypothetical protein SEA_VERSE_38 [Streptomyces phage Verse]|uniref:Uncharacterized protein n=2 Tax=Streptomyces phage Amela TaxID=1673877 RepID=A0A0K1YA60_9CAUD|nr:hypothetical protein AVT29_gp38 [Streptomyces phage Amela]AKY03793.1 hypothetical protein SEA_AMELA_38 [Streptomyces phage Amela]AKY03868.1 hypothetical protein SEA_VERSE_38 [Streptomyces phage Verse]
MIRGFEDFLEWADALTDYLADPESDLPLILAVEEAYEVVV